VDFEGASIPPQYVHAMMPKVDGVLQIFDSAAGDGGMDVALYLDTESMDNLLADNTLLNDEVVGQSTQYAVR
jgi:hypothetical protein